MIAQHARLEIVAQESSLSPVLDEMTLGEGEEDEITLNKLNGQIKCTLTDLLNCEGVKSDRRYSKWVQTRLIDTEKELKEFRRERQQQWHVTEREVS